MISFLPLPLPSSLMSTNIVALFSKYIYLPSARSIQIYQAVVKAGWSYLCHGMFLDQSYMFVLVLYITKQKNSFNKLILLKQVARLFLYFTECIDSSQYCGLARLLKLCRFYHFQHQCCHTCHKLSNSTSWSETKPHQMLVSVDIFVIFLCLITLPNVDIHFQRKKYGDQGIYF